MEALKISTSWVRGVVGDALTPELIVRFACAFGTWAEGGPVVIARDTRVSSPMMRAAVVAGLMSTGCDVVDLGICSTPLVSFAVRDLGCAGGISITGSHNSADWNALKFAGPDGVLLNAAKGEELLDIYHESAFAAASPGRLSVIGEPSPSQGRYLEYLLACLDVGRIQRAGFAVAADFCNGACAHIASRFLRELNCALIPLHAEPSGRFAHPPAPSPANMGDLAQAVLAAQADLGAAINIDGDRVAFILADGRPLSEEYTLPLAALNRLERRPGLTVTNLSTSRMIDTLARRFGQAVVRAPVGESPVMDCGLAHDAVLAGEGSGGVAALPASMTFDALLTLGMVLETMAASGAALSDLAAQLPRYEMRKDTFPCRPDQAYRTLESFRSYFDVLAPDYSDGVRVEWHDAWLHVRFSSTEPLLRVIVEAEEGPRADALFAEAAAFVQRAILKEGRA